MRIEEYANYFHDGTLREIKQNGDHLKLVIESGTFSSNDLVDRNLLSIVGTLRGILHFEGLKSIHEYDEEIPLFSKKGYDAGEINHMNVEGNSALLVIAWENYGRDKPPNTTMFDYKFVADKIYWENTPLATLPFDDSPIEENTQHLLGGKIYRIRWGDYSCLTVWIKGPPNDQKLFDGWLSIDATRILVNGVLMSDEKFDMDCDGTIVDLKIDTHNMILEIDWKEGPPGRSGTREVFEIESWATHWQDKPAPKQG